MKFLDADSDSDCHQNLISCPLATPTPPNSSKFVQNLPSNLADRQTDRQTDPKT